MNPAHQLAASVASVRARIAQPASARTNNKLEALVLNWFAQMHAGQIDRTQLAPEYSAHLTDDAIRDMSRFLKEYHFGSSPTSAHILRTHSGGNQTFCLAKVLFPRGDAASLLFGFDARGRITGISLMSMAGD